MHKIAPCKGCTWWLGKRISHNCHDTCQRFLDWRMTVREDRRHREEIDEYISDEIRKKIRHRNLRGGAK